MTSNTTPATPAQTTPAPRRLTLRRESLIVALGAVGAGVIFLAPVAQADTPGIDPGGTTAPGGASPAPGVDVTADADFTPVLNDPNYYKNIGDKAHDQFVGGTTAVTTTTIGDPNTIPGGPGSNPNTVAAGTAGPTLAADNFNLGVTGNDLAKKVLSTKPPHQGGFPPISPNNVSRETVATAGNSRDGIVRVCITCR